jgi:hypothetical protein
MGEPTLGHGFVAQMLLAQPLLGTLELEFELMQVGVRSQAPPIQLGSQQGHSIVRVANVCLQELDLVARAHRSTIAITASRHVSPEQVAADTAGAPPPSSCG